MGNDHSKKKSKKDKYTISKKEEAPPSFHAIRDTYETIEQVQEALAKCGLESSNLVIGVDYTASNTSAGKATFNGKCLHTIDPDIQNPYQEVIRIIGRTLKVFDDDGIIPAFGFGDKLTEGTKVFPFMPPVDGKPQNCQGFEHVLQRYNEITPSVQLAGPTSFAPIIRETIRIVANEGEFGYHILIIIADGQVTQDSEWGNTETETRNAIVEASKYPISIIVVGVGDGPWAMMEEYDDQLPERKFDNFQFVDFHRTMSYAPEPYKDVHFALAALMEIPEQYATIKKLKLIKT